MDPTRAQPASPGLAELVPAGPPLRAAVVTSLVEVLTRAVAVGDEMAARVVYEAIGRLLGLPLAFGDGGEPAAMVDLARERARPPRR